MQTPTRLPAGPGGLPPATAVYRLPARSSWQALVILVAGLLAFAALSGGWPPPTGVVVIASIGVVWLGLRNLRQEVSAGPGWFAAQGLLRRRWVRTDQLVTATQSRSGLDRVVILTDRDGRRVGVMFGLLTGNHAVRVQLSRDVRTSVSNGLTLEPAAARLLGAERV